MWRLFVLGPFVWEQLLDTLKLGSTRVKEYAGTCNSKKAPSSRVGVAIQRMQVKCEASKNFLTWHLLWLKFLSDIFNFVAGLCNSEKMGSYIHLEIKNIAWVCVCSAVYRLKGEGDVPVFHSFRVRIPKKYPPNCLNSNGARTKSSDWLLTSHCCHSTAPHDGGVYL